MRMRLLSESDVPQLFDLTPNEAGHLMKFCKYGGTVRLKCCLFSVVVTMGMASSYPGKDDIFNSRRQRASLRGVRW